MKMTLCAVLALICLASSAKASNLITNGGFETGDLTGWTSNPFNNGHTQEQVYSGNYCCQGATPPEGNFAVAFGGGGKVTGEIAQEFATIPGATYHGSLQYAGVGGANDGDLEVILGDATHLTVLSDSGALQPLFNGSWSTYNFTFTATSALSGIDIISPNGSGTDYNVDNVFIANVPEPCMTLLLSQLAIGVCILIRRRRKQHAATTLTTCP